MPKTKTIPFTVEYLKTIFDYDKENGLLYWKDRYNSVGRNIGQGGKKAGTKDFLYYKIVIHNQRFTVHRLIYYIETGEQPELIDHINGDGFDNRIGNLRPATHSINSRNQRRHKRNTTGVTGVGFDSKWGKYTAAICVGGIKMYLGRFTTLESARLAREAANIKYGFGINHGK